MPAYELFLIVKALERPNLVKSIKRGAEVILNKNGIIRSFENMGYKKLPYKMQNEKNGNYILIKFDMPSQNTSSLSSEIGKDNEYLRYSLTALHEYEEDYETDCLCEEKGEFLKNAFNFEKPMTVHMKKRIYKNYGLRL